MGGFRIGRTRAQHTYPESRRNTTVPYARNSALFVLDGQGNTPMVLSGTPTPIPWTSIESTFPTGGVDVPITPRTTGLVLLTGMVTATVSPENSEANLLVQIKVGTALLTVPFALEDIPAGTAAPQTITIPIVFSGPIPLPIGVTTNIQIQVSQTVGSDAASVVDATLSLQEVQLPTG